jgi:PAS domain S-box-containing protein
MKKSGQKRNRSSGSPKARDRAKPAAKDQSRQKKSPAARKIPPIVGIGASAGGLEAFTQLLRALPADTGMAFVLVQHLEPSRESVLTKLLARATRMPVQEVREGMRAEPNQVYVIPANADLSLIDGLLHIVGRKAPAGHHLPIDYFFRSLAETLKSQAIGVILSGTASDGTAGLKAIKVEGGVTFAQEPSSAKFDGMPRSAIAAGCVDLVLPPERIAAELARLARHPFVALLPPDVVPALPAKEEDWARLFRLLRTTSGVDFTFYKKSTIKRRLARRMALHKVESMSAYLKLIEEHREELDAIFHEILINVTSFFREPDAFDALAQDIFPRLLKGGPAGEAIRIWVPGCSTGEEAYSIAICLLEHLDDRASATPIQIFATDVSDTAIEKARAGVYPADALHEASPERVRRFFTAVEGNYEVKPAVREICVFARHDLTKDPPFSRLDLISCRNVLIYFEPILQRRVLTSFHYALKSTGMLLLGKSETLGGFADLFTIADSKSKFFIKNTAATVDLSNVLSTVDIPILILGSDRRIRSFTPPAQKLLGLLPGDVGRPIGNLRIGVVVPDLGELISAVIGRAAEMRRDVQSEDGRWYSLRIHPLSTSEHKIEGVLLAFVDIHELKQNQDILLKERNFISAILDAAKDLLVVVLDREGRIVQFNGVCQQLTGYSLEEVKGRRPWDFLLLPDETAAIRENFTKVLGGSPSQSESHWVAKDGRRLLISWSHSAAASNGAVESVIATGLDRTERATARQRAEEGDATIRALLETAAQAILAIDPQGRIVLANAAAEGMFGYPRDELMGQPIEKLIPERVRARHVEHRATWFSQPRSRPMGLGRELAGLRKDGTKFPTEISLSYVGIRDGVRAVAFVSDISERKSNEATLLAYQKDLQRLAANLLRAQESGNRDLSRELHDVFSQDLAGLGMEISSLLESIEGTGPLKERLKALGKKIGNLADEMHRTSRQLHPAILDELGLEAALREECGNFSKQSGIPVRFAYENLPRLLPEAVSLCLYRVAQESLRNVRKHTGATEVRLRLEGVDAGVNLRVEDTGDGFDVNQARKTGGLGLISMEERVRSVNGKFTIHSKGGTGTTVEVFVPLAGNAS